MSSSYQSSYSPRYLFRKLAGNVLYHLPKKTARAIRFQKQHGYKMNFDNPRTLDEKLNWLLVYHIGPEYADYVDKIAVRDYVSACGLGELLPKIYGMWSHTAEIPLEELPGQFVLKCNHASGGRYYEIVRDKSAVDWTAVLTRLEKMLHTNYAKTHCEYQYGPIKPRVYAEELLDDGDLRMTDYKVYCYDGEPHCIMACAGRGGHLRRAFYDKDWNYLNYGSEVAQTEAQIAQPKGLETMLEAAAILSKPFPFARVDFYDVSGKVYFGEITLTPDNCNIQHLSDEGQKILGELLDLKPLMERKKS